MRHRLRKLAWYLFNLVVVGLVLAIGYAVHVANLLAEPVPRNIQTPEIQYPVIEPVAFDSTSGSRIRGWFVRGHEDDKATVVLMHGVRGDRRGMITRALFLLQAGYSTLLFDFQGHGESRGNAITFGYLESRDARAAMAHARKLRPGSKVAAIGQSLGGAACLIGEEPLNADALVVEAVYTTLHSAIANRLYHALGLVGWLGTPLLTCQTWYRLGVSVDACRPLDGIRRFRGAVMVIAGTVDPHTPLAESQQLFEAANEPKEFWPVENAGHVDFHAVAREDYEARVLAFLARYL